jgi:hypothetical protein
MPEMPAYWLRMCQYSLQSRVSLAKELWQIFCELHPEQAQSLAYSLHKLDTEPVNAAILQQRFVHLQGVLTPRSMVALCVRLAPEGRLRRKDVLEFEEKLLKFVDANGHFV